MSEVKVKEEDVEIEDQDDDEKVGLTEEEILGLSDEDSKALIDGKKEVEDVLKEEDEDDDDEGEKKGEKKSEKEEKEEKVDAEDEKKEEDKEESEDKDKKLSVEEQIAALKVEVGKSNKRNDDQAAFINKQGNIIGDLRKQIGDGTTGKLPDISQEQLAELYQSDPQKATEYIIAKNAEQGETLKLAKDIQGMEKRQARQEWLGGKAEGFDDEVEDIVNILVEDGFLKEQLSTDMKNDIYQMNEFDLFNLFHRSKQKKEIVELKETISTRDKTIEELSKKAGKVANKIKKAASEESMDGGASGVKNVNDDDVSLTEEEILNLPPGEAAKLLKKLEKKS